MDIIILILRALIPLGIIALFFGLLIGFSTKYLHTEKDTILEKVLTILPGTDCGGCGYATCEEYARALMAKEVRPHKCTLADNQTILKLARLSGQKALKPVKMRAQVMCSGTSELAPKKYNYDGIMDCVSVSRIGVGDKACPYGCLGYGTCVKSCPFGAIKVENGVAVVEYEKCMGCGLCEKACPKNIIKLVPYRSEYWVGCSSHNDGATVKSYCGIGCIACGICEKNCPTDAVKLVDNIAKIDYKKCIQCGTCFEKCPRSTIWYGIFQIANGDTRPGSLK